MIMLTNNVVMALLILVPCSAESGADSGDMTIRGRAGRSDIVIRTTSRLAGAIDSLQWDGVEFVNSTDHGRQIQSAANFDAGRVFFPEVFNPTEAGSMRDGAGPTSSSKLLSARASGSELLTVNQPAFWLAPNEKSQGHPAYNTTVLSNHRISKRVKIGHGKLANVIEYDVTFQIPADEHHTYAQFEAVTGYMPAHFTNFWTFDGKSQDLLPLSDGPGEQKDPVVLSTRDGRHAMGIYSPDQPSPGYAAAGYGRFRFKAEKVVKWNSVFRVRKEKGVAPGDYLFHNFVIVGSLDEVKQSLIALKKEEHSH